MLFKQHLFSAVKFSAALKSLLLGTLVAVIHKNFLESRQYVLSFYSFTGVHGWNYSVSKVSSRWNLETRLSCVHQLFKSSILHN